VVSKIKNPAFLTVNVVDPSEVWPVAASVAATPPVNIPEGIVIENGILSYAVVIRFSSRLAKAVDPFLTFRVIYPVHAVRSKYPVNTQTY